jgi:hypothetical protein
MTSTMQYSMPEVGVYVPLAVNTCMTTLVNPEPPPAGVAHVASPRQKVLELAPVPLFKFVTGKFPVTPVVRGNPVQFVNVPLVGVPKIGVTNVGVFANTSAPVPVSSVTAAAKLAELGVAKNVATLAPRPLTPELIGRPIQFVNVPLVGVPSAGVTSVGDVAKTKEPEPVSSVTAAAKLPLDGVARNVAMPAPNPLTPVDIGNPVQLVSVPLLGVPKTGVMNEGVLLNTREPLPVSSVTAAARFALLGVARNVATLAPSPETPVLMGRPVQFVNVPLLGVPSAGVTKVGDVLKTSEPEPVSSVTAAARFALVGVAKKVATFAPSPLTPVEIGSPVQLVRVPLVGVPKIGVTSVGLVARTGAPLPVNATMEGKFEPSVTSIEFAAGARIENVVALE